MLIDQSAEVIIYENTAFFQRPSRSDFDQNPTFHIYIYKHRYCTLRALVLYEYSMWEDTILLQLSSESLLPKMIPNDVSALIVPVDIDSHSNPYHGFGAIYISRTSQTTLSFVILDIR